MQCLILAGGLGTRMGSYTKSIPKSLIPVSGVPFAHYQLQLLAEQGVQEIVYSIGYLGDQIRDFVRDGSQWGLSVSYVDEEENLLGTGGALRLAFDKGLLAERFLVLYGDAFLPIDYQAVWNFFNRSPHPALMTVFKNGNLWDKSNVLFRDGVLESYNKKEPTAEFQYIDYGVSAFTRSLIPELIPAGQKIDLGDVCHTLSMQKRLAGYEVRQRFFEIGSSNGLADFEALVKGNHVEHA